MNLAVSARARRDQGIELSEAKANRDQPGWSEDAQAALEKFCLAHPGQKFLTEDVRAWAEELELVEAPDNAKAWGAVMQRAARFGTIRRVGYMPAKSSNLSPKTAWMAVA